MDALKLHELIARRYRLDEINRGYASKSARIFVSSWCSTTRTCQRNAGARPIPHCGVRSTDYAGKGVFLLAVQAVFGAACGRATAAGQELFFRRL
jgi:hypothetical protein